MEGAAGRVKVRQNFCGVVFRMGVCFCECFCEWLLWVFPMGVSTRVPTHTHIHSRTLTLTLTHTSTHAHSHPLTHSPSQTHASRESCTCMSGVTSPFHTHPHAGAPPSSISLTHLSKSPLSSFQTPCDDTSVLPNSSSRGGCSTLAGTCYLH